MSFCVCAAATLLCSIMYLFQYTILFTTNNVLFYSSFINKVVQHAQKLLSFSLGTVSWGKFDSAGKFGRLKTYGLGPGIEDAETEYRILSKLKEMEQI